MKKTTTLMLFALLTSLCPLGTAQETNRQTTMFEMYKDVPKNHWAYDAIFELSQKGVMIGYFDKNDKTFKGERNLTRYEFALALAKAMIKIEENIKADQKGIDIETYLKSRNVPAKDIELLSMLMQEFKSELNELNIRMTRMEEYHKRSPHSNLPLYFSIGSLLASFAALTLAIQK
jgi:hypothetical protein